ncbi:hypothetical protein WICMUC_003298 [Wickerhamomyces mucosus]|uniref:Ankyrin repeat protein nuc-2 n=1 Tax=Wickerhamomyces mucosus TaxID=1378264 RepID=A0A9P8TCU9_9ASCO|nr:hypothetical protein WICMUC_003298 [Wickerhamomyces mucosus]
MIQVVKESHIKTPVNQSLLFQFIIDGLDNESYLDINYELKKLLNEVESRIKMISYQYNDIISKSIVVILTPINPIESNEKYFQLCASILTLSESMNYPYIVSLSPTSSKASTKRASQYCLDESRTLMLNLFSGNRSLVKLIQDQKQAAKELNNVENFEEKLIPLLLQMLELYDEFDEDVIFDIVKNFNSLKQVAQYLKEQLDHQNSLKFGKYLEARQLELPEYIGHFINYKALKKLIKSLAVPQYGTSTELDIERTLQENKTSFFFRLERELEKVNAFYVEKESDLKIRLDILVGEKNNAITKNRLGSKTSIAYIKLYDGFKRFSRDLDRLEQFVELNQTGFSKVLKKWDKRSKSHTKELYLSKAISVQPVFNRDEISQLNDLCTNSLIELDEKAEGENSIRFDYESNLIDRQNSVSYSDFKNLQLNSLSKTPPNEKIDELSTGSKVAKIFVDDIEIDELYSEFLNIAYSSTVNNLLLPFINRIKNSPNSQFKLTRLFFLSIPTKVTDEILFQFYNESKNLINLSTVDELSKRTMIHEACTNIYEKRCFIVELGITNNLNLNKKDISGRVPLHYAAELGRIDLIKLLCDKPETLNFLNALDHDAMSPLLLAIDKNHIKTIETLIELGADPAPQNSETNPQYLPLNFACKSGNYEVAQLLLSHANVKRYQKDAEGLLPLHVVAKTGNFQLVSLLTSNDADPNALDGFNKWPPIFYSASEGHPRTTEALIKAGAEIEIKDEKNYTPLFYASWEGHVDVLNVLIDALQKKKHSKNILSPLKESNTLKIPPSPSLNAPTFQLSPENFNIDAIPDLSLPPPIIPLRRYGHNFLEKKIFVQLHFSLNRDSIIFNQDEVISSLPGRIVISSKISDVVPRNILLPVSDNDNTVAFQVDSLDKFSIDFEIFPSFGTKLIAKTSALSNVFNQVSNGGLNNHAILPLFDSRLRSVGELNFQFQIIHPYSGIPLEISKYDTYWKSTSGGNNIGNIQSSVLSFVTASSLSGDYVKINVTSLSDGTPIVCPSWNITVLDTLISLFNLTVDQLKAITNYSIDNFNIDKTSTKSPSFYKELKTLVDQNFILLDDFLKILPEFVNLDVEVLYPTESEIKSVPITLPEATKLDEFIDSILTFVFNHVREVRTTNAKKTRSLVFSSNNQSVCSILNWKQPNYPVLFNISGIHFNNDKFEVASANGYSNESVLREESTIRSLSEATRFSTLNNLLGIIVPHELLVLVPDLIDTIRSRGLILVGSRKGSKNFESEDYNSTTVKSDINGTRFEDILSFKGDIDM